MCLCFPISTVEAVDKPYAFVLWVTTTPVWLVLTVVAENLVLLSAESIQKMKVAGFPATLVTVRRLLVATT
jgi:uncharacterized protein (DUF983 family)